jgi:hypothetical protein
MIGPLGITSSGLSKFQEMTQPVAAQDLHSIGPTHFFVIFTKARRAATAQLAVR